MSLATRFLKASASVAAIALAAGCATNPLPEYRSVDAGTRTNGTPIDTQGVRYYPNGEVVAVNYKACSALKTATRSVTNNRTVERSIDQGTRKIGRSAGTQRGRNNLGDAITGAIAGVGAAIVGQQANNALKTPQIAQLEAVCNQERARDAWEKGQKAAARAVNECIKRESRNGVPYTQALPVCQATVLGR